ncbi:hypothetical protein [Nonomuraea sp. NPDC050786]|uniref:hypothetical protein n=1 Tax=Nonomuraea sp. NPDC050786 TaxID=3154840 RepID=UPI0033FE4DA8
MGRYLAAGSQVNVAEGEPVLSHPVLIESSDLPAAHVCPPYVVRKKKDVSRYQPGSDVPSSYSQVLEEHLAEWSGRTGITVEVWALPKMHLAGRLSTIVHRVITEVLLEIERHAQARTVSVALTTSHTGLRLVISDDGGGMTVKAREALETRLLTSRGELDGLGGGLGVNSVLGEGVTVSASLPPQAFEHTPENYSPVPTSLRGVVDRRLLRRTSQADEKAPER